MRGDQQLTDTAFDVLSVEALFLVPRYFASYNRLLLFQALISCKQDLLFAKPASLLRHLDTLPERDGELRHAFVNDMEILLC